MPEHHVAASARDEFNQLSLIQKKRLAEKLVWRPTNSLKPFPNNPRTHPQAQIAALMRSIKHFWTNPILIDEDCTILAGHGRLEAATKLGLKRVPTLTLAGLSPAEKLATVIADNKLPEQAIWDFPTLRNELKTLIDLDFDVELSGFSTGEVDVILDGNAKPTEADPEDDLSSLPPAGPPVTRPGDRWILGRHQVLCGDSRTPEAFQQLMGRERAQMVVTDPPFNVPITGHARGRGKIRHREFAMASGEMPEPQFEGFLNTAMRLAVAASMDGSIHYWFQDWRHLPILLRASASIYSEWKNLLVWAKSNAGQGSFYRSQHELIAVFKAGHATHINNFGLGAKGRYRTNVLQYPGTGGLSTTRREELDMHPTVKPVALIADLVRDCSQRNGIILDPFGGSGTTALAAERTGRIGRLIEIDPLYVDLTVRRWEQTTGQNARHAETGRPFGSETLNEPFVADPPPRSRRERGGRS